MSEFDEKLNSILNDPGSMAQIMQLAQSLSGGTQSSPTDAAPTTPPPPAQSASPVGSGFEGFDPQTLNRFLPLLREMQSEESSSASQFLLALKPYLRVEKQEKVSRAIRIARLIRMGRHFFSGLEE